MCSMQDRLNFVSKILSQFLSIWIGLGSQTAKESLNDIEKGIKKGQKAQKLLKWRKQKEETDINSTFKTWNHNQLENT